MRRVHHFHRRHKLHPILTPPPEGVHFAKRTLRAASIMMACLSAAILLLLAAATAVSWVFAPFPIGAVLLGVSCFALLWLALITGAYVRQYRRYLALLAREDYPTVFLSKTARAFFVAGDAEEARACLRTDKPLACAGKVVPFPQLAPRDVALLAGKKIVLHEEMKRELALRQETSALSAVNELYVIEQL